MQAVTSKSNITITVCNLTADLNQLAVTNNSPKLLLKWADMDRKRNKMVNNQQQKCLKYVEDLPA